MKTTRSLTAILSILLAITVLLPNSALRVEAEGDETHEHVAAEAVTENEVKATCERGGSYDTVVYCSECGEELSRETVTTNPLGHDWGTPVYVWFETDEGYDAMARTTCQNDSSHVIEEYVTAVYSISVAPGCEEAGVGLYTATFKNEQFEEKYKTVSLKATGHSWKEAEYTWTETEDGYEVTAKRVCENDASHVEEETVTASKEVNAEANCEEGGSVTYTAVFDNKAFEEQVKEEETEALGHSWGEWEVTKEATPTEDGEKIRVCLNDEAHKETEVIPATGEIIYSFTAGADSSWTKGGSTALEFAIQRNIDNEETYSLFVSVAIDGNEVDASSYTASEGSLNLKLSSSYLKSLKVGKHTLTVYFEDGSVSCEFEIKDAPVYVVVNTSDK